MAHATGRLRNASSAAMRHLRVAAAVALLGIVAACSGVTVPSPTASSKPDQSPSLRPASPTDVVGSSAEPVDLQSPPVVSLDEVPLMCGSPLTFSVDALAGMPGAELADHPAARNLRQRMADGSVPFDRATELALIVAPELAHEWIHKHYPERPAIDAKWSLERMIASLAQVDPSTISQL